MDTKETIRTVTRDAQTFRITPFSEDQLDYLEEYVLIGQVSEVLRLTEEYDELDQECSDAQSESDRLRDVMDEIRDSLTDEIDWETDDDYDSTVVIANARQIVAEMIDRLKVYR